MTAVEELLKGNVVIDSKGVRLRRTESYQLWQIQRSNNVDALVDQKSDFKQVSLGYMKKMYLIQETSNMAPLTTTKDKPFCNLIKSFEVTQKKMQTRTNNSIDKYLLRDFIL